MLRHPELQPAAADHPANPANPDPQRTARSSAMTERPTSSPQPASAIPPDNPARTLALVRPDGDEKSLITGGDAPLSVPRSNGGRQLRHIAVVGDTYTILLTGEETGGRYCLIDMYVPPGGGPPPHRHDFEEMFSILEGEIEVTFRGERATVRAGETVNVPANAPHAFRNASSRPARLLCLCSPPGQEECFLAIGDPVASRTAPAPELSETELAERMAKARALAPRYRTELHPVEVPRG
jgi:mannose-6-phosphate isomerase-like protein (cupin superfamily)